MIRNCNIQLRIYNLNAVIASSNDYYPGGMQMVGRRFTQGSNLYRFGFNGKEKSNEVEGDGNIYDYGFRIYNPRIARFLSTDPLTREYPWYTPYQFAGNKPIWAIDLDGLEEYLVTNYYDHRGRIEETAITVINVKSGGREDMKLQDADGGYLAKKKVLVRNVQPHGQTTYEHHNQLNPEQSSIVAKAKKELINPKVSPFALEGGRGAGKINDGGDYYTTEKDDYTKDKYQPINYDQKYTFLPNEIKAGRDFAIIHLNGETDVMKDSKGNNVLNGSIDEFSKTLKALPDQIKKDKTIKSINVNLIWDVGPGVTGVGLDVVTRAIARTGQEIKNHLLQSGVKNVSVNARVNVTNNINNSDALTIKLNR